MIKPRSDSLVQAILSVVLFACLGLLSTSQGSARASASAGFQPADRITVPEGHDFASTVLRDAWDMGEFSDISMYLNQSGQVDQLQNVSVSSGVLSARVSSLKQSSVTLLFPGYKNALLSGKTGHSFPIDAATFKCLYVAAKVDSGPPSGGAPDQMVAFWFADENLNNGTWGVTIPGIWLYPEAGPGVPTPSWKLYSQRLDQASVPASLTPWNQAPGGKWRGLRIDPTLQATTFAMDWVRLTDCQPVYVTLAWQGSGPVTLSLQPAGTNREIQVMTITDQNPLQFDSQGLQVGRYTYFVRNTAGQVLSSGELEVKPSAVATFLKPSFTSGDDYATLTGHPWDFSDPADVVSAECVSATSLNGLLSMDTLSAASQPPGCHAGIMDVANPVVFLRTPTPIDPSQYRYLTFRMNTEGIQQDVPQGMIARWIWYIQGASSGLPANRCILTTYGIPFDVGWQVITIDLQDPLEGRAEERAGDCPASYTWTGSSPVLQAGFKPNENALGRVLHQDLDWIRLTKMDETRCETGFKVQIKMNLNWAELSSHSLFYTNDRQNPLQHVASLIHAPQASGSNRVYLPVLSPGHSTQMVSQNLIILEWDTSKVAAGRYYVCLQAAAYGSTNISCSDAPVDLK